MDPMYAHMHREELLAEVVEHRLARICRRRHPSPVLRLYARLWWASRPRAGAWPRVVLGA